MDPLREKAFFLLVWRAFLTALITVLLMIAGSFELAIAFLVGANVALLFSLGLILWSQRLTEEGVTRTEAWQMLNACQRPAGIGGRRWARRQLSDEALMFAKAASAVAAILSASAFIFAIE
jgi:hypothetical protein